MTDDNQTLYPGSMQYAPMRYAIKPSENQVQQAWSSGEWIAQEKKDGAFYQLEKTDAGDVYMFGRTISKKTGEYTEKSDNFPHIKKWAEQYLPNGTILIGEIYVPGGKSNDVTKISGCTSANAYKRQFESSEYQPVHYYIFDCIRYKGENLCDETTVDRIEHYLYCELVDLFNDEQYVELAETYYKDFEEHLQKIFSNGGEGMVFKKKDCPYRVGKRTTASQMFKYKEHLDSIDLVCMELLDPEPIYTGKDEDNWPYWAGQTFVSDYLDKGYYKINPCLMFDYKPKKDELLPLGYSLVPITKHYYYGWKNAMRLGAYKDGQLIEVCRVASGLTDELREDMANNPDNYLNKVVEIECMSINKKDGTVRHPVFRRMREDKGSQDCLYEEIFS